MGSIAGLRKGSPGGGNELILLAISSKTSATVSPLERDLVASCKSNVTPSLFARRTLAMALSDVIRSCNESEVNSDSLPQVALWPKDLVDTCNHSFVIVL